MQVFNCKYYMKNVKHQKMYTVVKSAHGEISHATDELGKQINLKRLAKQINLKRLSFFRQNIFFAFYGAFHSSAKISLRLKNYCHTITFV